MDASWSSGNAFVSGAGGFRFKFQDGQIQRWSPQEHPWPEDTFLSPWFWPSPRSLQVLENVLSSVRGQHSFLIG